MTTNALIAPIPHDADDSTCAATTKAGRRCPITPMAGRNVCLVHDPEMAMRGRAAGWLATKGPRCLSANEAARIIRLAHRGDVPGTIEAVARAIACGELDTRIGSALIVAAGAVVQAINSVDRAAKHAAANMTDDELDAAIESEIEERLKRRALAGGS